MSRPTRRYRVLRLRAKGARLLQVVCITFAISGCSTTSNTVISESTTPAHIRTQDRDALASGYRQIIVTSAEIKSTDQDDLRDAAIERAKARCGEFAIDREMLRTGEETTSAMIGIRGPWIEMHVICARSDTGNLKGAAAVVVETESEKFGDHAFFDTHAETFSGSFETVFSVVTRVLTSQGDPIYRSDKERGIIITGRARHGALGFPTYEQYVIVMDEVSAGSTRVTFKLFVHVPNFAMERSYATMPPAGRKFVYQRAAVFVDNVKRALR